MIKISFVILSYFCLSIFKIGYSQENQMNYNTTVAVLEFIGYGITEDESLIFTSRFTSDLVNTNKFHVISRDNMKEILQEQGFQQSGCTEIECAVEIGKLLNAQKMISGEIGKINEKYNFVVSIINVESGKIESSISKEYKGVLDEMLEHLSQIAKELADKSYNKNNLFEQNSEKIYLKEKSFDKIDSVKYAEKEKISGFRAALYSAVIPGAGQYYAESYWRAAIYSTLEVAIWTTYFIYDSKGADKDKQMRNFGDEYWSEQKYWSKIYYESRQAQINNLDGFDDLPVYQYNPTTEYLVDYDRDIVNSLRKYEGRLNYSHSLPSSHTQQYYEMIYKYPEQFANGWDDAILIAKYSPDASDLPKRAINYRYLRNLTEEYYDVATAATMAALVNHVISALDAALAAKSYNNSLNMRFTVKDKYMSYEKVRLYGLQFTW